MRSVASWFMVALLTAAALLSAGIPRSALAQEAATGEAAKLAAPVLEPRALDLLRRMSTRLAETPSFGVWTRGMREIPAEDDDRRSWYGPGRVHSRLPTKEAGA